MSNALYNIARKESHNRTGTGDVIRVIEFSVAC